MDGAVQARNSGRIKARQKTLNRVYHQHPQRFNKPPRTPQIRNEAWINEPAKETTTTTEKIEETV